MAYLLGRKNTKRVQNCAGLKTSYYAHSAEPKEIIFPVHAAAPAYFQMTGL
jgi:hypothetical protein